MAAATPPEPERPGEPAIVTRLRARQAEHRARGRLYRAAFVVAGAVVLLAGIAMLVLPGPAFLVIPIGLAILSLEFAWAEHLLERALVKGEQARRSATAATPAQKALTAAAIVCGVAAAARRGARLGHPVPARLNSCAPVARRYGSDSYRVLGRGLEFSRTWGIEASVPQTVPSPPQTRPARVALPAARAPLRASARAASTRTGGSWSATAAATRRPATS